MLQMWIQKLAWLGCSMESGVACRKESLQAIEWLRREYSSHGSVDALGGRCDGLQGHRMYKGQRATHEKRHFDRCRDQGKRPTIDGVDLVIDLPSIRRCAWK